MNSKAETWGEFWARAVEDCIANNLPVPPIEQLAAEYAERARQRAALEAWTETTDTQGAA